MIQHSQINECDSPHKQNEDKNHMIISIDAEKAFDKIQHPFLIKTLSKVGIEAAFLNIIKAIYDLQPTSYSKTKIFPTKIRNKTRMTSLTTPIQHSIGSLATAIRQEKAIKASKLQRRK